MIRDRKGGPWGRVVDWYVARKVRQGFRGVWMRGAVPDAPESVIFYGNHSSFWDGFVIHQMGKVLGFDGYAVMEEQHMARYPFHARLGAISVRRGDPASALQTIRYGQQVLKRQRAALFVFPEGVMRPGATDVAPLERGVEVLARASKVRSIPVAIRYVFLEHEFPDVLMEFGPAHGPAPLETYQQSLARVHQRAMSATSTEGFCQMVVGRTGVQQRWDAARGERPSLKGA